MDTKIAEAQIAAAEHNCNEGWPFPDAQIIIDGYKKAIERIKELEDTSFTIVRCNIKSCRYSKQGICKHTSIYLQGCSPDADNVVACSEFCEH